MLIAVICTTYICACAGRLRPYVCLQPLQWEHGTLIGNRHLGHVWKYISAVLCRRISVLAPLPLHSLDHGTNSAWSLGSSTASRSYNVTRIRLRNLLQCCFTSLRPLQCILRWIKLSVAAVRVALTCLPRRLLQQYVTHSGKSHGPRSMC